VFDAGDTEIVDFSEKTRDPDCYSPPNFAAGPEWTMLA
jgi:hypothetical protein